MRMSEREELDSIIGAAGLTGCTQLSLARAWDSSTCSALGVTYRCQSFVTTWYRVVKGYSGEEYSLVVLFT